MTSTVEPRGIGSADQAMNASRPAADFDHDLPRTGSTAGGNDEDTDGADQGFIPGHDQPLLTMPDLDFTHYRLATE